MPIILFNRPLIIASLVLLLTACVVAQASGQKRSLRLAVLDLGQTTAARVAREAITKQLSANPNMTLVDRDQAMAAANGVGYRRSLNLSLQEARDLGSAIGCDFIVLGEADTLRRLPSADPPYFESYASIFIVSARTGRLVLWEESVGRGPTAKLAEERMLVEINAPQTASRYISAVFSATEKETGERLHAVAQPVAVIEAMSDTVDETNDGARPPRAFRRLKPVYPPAAAHAEVEAVVDVLVDVDEKGEVSRTEIARWAGYGLDESVIDTVRQLHFFPAMRNGHAIPMRVLLRYNFRKPAQ